MKGKIISTSLLLLAVLALVLQADTQRTGAALLPADSSSALESAQTVFVTVTAQPVFVTVFVTETGQSVSSSTTLSSQTSETTSQTVKSKTSRSHTTSTKCQGNPNCDEPTLPASFSIIGAWPFYLIGLLGYLFVRVRLIKRPITFQLHHRIPHR